MRGSIVALSCLAGLAATSLGAGTAAGAEAPSVTVQANAPGWITVYYSHSGTGEVREYKIQRQGGGGTTLYSPNGQWTDSHLEPDTQYAYTVCAVYDDGDEACSSPVAARTLPAPGKPANFDPPTITNLEVNENSIKVTWGQTGDYPSILVHLSDPQGNVDQRKLQNIPNGSQTFVGLRSGVRYRVILKGYSKLGGTLPWSPDVFITTTLPPQEPPPPPPPSKPTLTVSGPKPGTVSLEFTVKVSVVGPDTKFMVYRDGRQVTEVPPRSDIGGLKGSYSDEVDLWERAHDYRVCFLGGAPTVKVCSDTVAGPPPSVDTTPKPPEGAGDSLKQMDPAPKSVPKPPRWMKP